MQNGSEAMNVLQVIARSKQAKRGILDACAKRCLLRYVKTGYAFLL